MELRHLRYFVAVAEERNFTRAAKRLGIKQPPLSLQIRQLEKEMGTALFRRETRGVELTGAGKLLLEEARLILRQVDRAKTSVRRRARGETGRINIGSAGGTYFHPLIPAIIREYGKRYPDVVISPEASNTSLLVARLRAGKIDIAFIRPPFEDSEGVATVQLVDEDALMVLPAGHALAGSVSAPLSAFARETFILFPRALHPGSYDLIIAACHRAGFDPVIGQEAPQIVSTVPLVAAGLGVALVPRSICGIHADGVFCLSIEGDMPRAEICLAYRRDDRSEAVKNFVAMARRLTAAAQPQRDEITRKVASAGAARH
ncbi:MAG TPA: LysR substrate-binding domain-containing protein [Xanthobacteraceae bacterium]|nr:LysR substrate-binding domain-containing protein [Xanthobacteraceae bacterium]